MTGQDPDALDAAANTRPRVWMSASSYWQPVHFPYSAWVTHAPFAFWLMDVLRPRSVVELGTHHGFSCFVFAEAARRLSLDCTIAAIDSWEGDDHAGRYGEEVFESVAAIVDRDYPDTVRMLRGYFEQSRHLIPDSSVDLLHIDGRHGYEDVLADYTSWRSAVRDGGVILFHDIAEHQEGFGVWKLWEELRAEYSTFEFEHGHGLGVLAVGEVRAASLAALFDADDASVARIRADYERLGAAVARQAALEGEHGELEKIRASRIWRWTGPLRSFLHQRALRRGTV